MSVNAFAAPGRRARWKRQRGRVVAQEALVLQPLDRRTRPKPSDNADRVPRLFGASRQLGLRPPFAKGRVPFAATTPNLGRSHQAWQIYLTLVLGIVHARFLGAVIASPTRTTFGGSRTCCEPHHHFTRFVPECCNRRSNSEQIAEVQPLTMNPSVQCLGNVRNIDTFAARCHGRFVADNLSCLAKS